MNRLILALGICVSLVFVSGCGSKAESLIEDQLELMDEMSEALEQNKPESEIEAFKERQEKLAQEADELKVTDDEKKRLEEKYKDKMEAAMNRLMKATMNYKKPS